MKTVNKFWVGTAILFHFALIISAEPSVASSSKATLAFGAGYGEDRKVYSLAISGGKAGRLNRIADYDRYTDVTQFTGRFLVTSDGNANTTIIRDLKTKKVVGESMYYSDRVAVGVIGKYAIYRIADYNGERMSGFVKNLITGDIHDLPKLKFQNPQGYYYWYDDQSVPRHSSSMYLGMNLSSEPDEMGYSEHAGYGIYRQDRNGYSLWRKLDTEYVTSFCISPSGKTIAYTEFASSNSFRKKLTILNFKSKKKTSLQGDWQLGGSCFAKDTLLFVSDGDHLYQITQKNGRYKKAVIKARIPLPIGEVAVAD